MSHVHGMDIVTLDKDPQRHLTTRCEAIPLNEKGLKNANETIAHLKATLQPLLPAAGLAAPQIGLKERIFIFSWNRTEENIAAAINPSYEPIDNQKDLGWEGCFSIMLGKGPYQLANVPRYRKIKVSYINEQGKPVSQTLEGFAARVFQHEFDHLEGVENIHRKDAEIKTFDHKADMSAFMADIRSKDKVNYIPPRE